MSRVLPILFNTEMVRAILDGRKTVTRRAIKRLPEGTYRIEQVEENDWEALYGIRNCGVFLDMYKTVKPPYQPGDIMYVRESGIIQSMKNFDKSVKIYFPADNSLIEFKVTPDEYERLSKFPENKKISPYWFTKQESRIWLKVTNVRVERLKDITEEGAIKEGLYKGWQIPALPKSSPAMTARQAFMWVWNSTIKKSDFARYGWTMSPWVWVIEFERCEKLEGEL